MEKSTYIYITEFCTQYGIEISFVQQLQEYEIVHVEVADDKIMISEEELPKLEKMVRLHHELDINAQGLQAIQHLLDKVTHLQEEVSMLRRKLNRFAEQ